MSSFTEMLQVYGDVVAFYENPVQYIFGKAGTWNIADFDFRGGFTMESLVSL